MTSHPQKAIVPESAFVAVERWLDVRSGARDAPRLDAPPPAPEAAILDSGDAGIIEAPFELETRDGVMRGVTTRSPGRPAPVCAVFLNAGSQRRIGPNRMWVETARRWATRGVASLRLDMVGIGESDGPTSPYERDMTLYRPEFPPRVIGVLDALQRDGIADRFVLIGLCAGAYWALHAGLDDDRVAAIMMLNPVAIIWDDDTTTAARDLRRVFTERSWRLIRKNATPQRLKAVARMLAGAPRRALTSTVARGGEVPSLQMAIEANLTRWRDPDTRIAAMFASREGLAMDLDRTGQMAELQRLPNVTIRRLAVNDHTLRPVAIQHVVHSELDAELDRVLVALAEDT